MAEPPVPSEMLEKVFIDQKIIPNVITVAPKKLLAVNVESITINIPITFCAFLFRYLNS